MAANLDVNQLIQDSLVRLLESTMAADIVEVCREASHEDEERVRTRRVS